MKALLSYIIFISLFYFSFLACNNESKKSDSSGFEREMEAININQFNDFIIDSGRVGIIKATDTKEDLQQKFGEDHLKLDSFYLEGMFQEMVLLIDSGKQEELEIHFNKDNQIASIRIKQAKSPYHYKNGIKLGSTLFDLAQFNNQPIKFYGFGWDYYGQITDLNGGKLKTDLPYFGGVLFPKINSEEIYKKYSGDSAFSSASLSDQNQKDIILEKFHLHLN